MADTFMQKRAFNAESISRWFQGLSPEARNAIIGALAGGGITGVGSAATGGNVASDSLIGALLGGVAGGGGTAGYRLAKGKGIPSNKVSPEMWERVRDLHGKHPISGTLAGGISAGIAGGAAGHQVSKPFEMRKTLGEFAGRAKGTAGAEYATNLNTKALREAEALQRAMGQTYKGLPWHKRIQLLLGRKLERGGRFGITAPKVEMGTHYSKSLAGNLWDQLGKLEDPKMPLRGEWKPEHLSKNIRQSLGKGGKGHFSPKNFGLTGKALRGGNWKWTVPAALTTAALGGLYGLEKGTD